jgi:molybdopterin molybdotransferase
VKGVPLIGLPGNPVAAALTFAILGRPLILRLAGAARRNAGDCSGARRVCLQEAAGRREYVRASLKRDGDAVTPHKYPKDGAGILSSIVRSDGFVIIDEAAEGLQPGATVDFLPYAEIIG